jgi:hypothetical protein
MYRWQCMQYSCSIPTSRYILKIILRMSFFRGDRHGIISEDVDLYTSH